MPLARSATLTSAISDTDATSTTTASITPTANALVLLYAFSNKATTPDTPTATGNGLTWVQVATVTVGTHRITCFRAMGASPSAGAVTIDWVNTQLARGHVIEQWTGVDTSGTNGSGALVQSATNSSGPDVTSLTVSLAALGSASNGTSSAFAKLVNTALTPRTGWTESFDGTSEAPECDFETQFKVAGEATASATTAGDPEGNFVGLAVEIKEEAGAPAVTIVILRTLIGVGQ